jgi:hypothetical protein
MNCIYTIAKKTVIGMAEMQDTNSKIIPIHLNREKIIRYNKKQYVKIGPFSSNWQNMIKGVHTPGINIRLI